MKHREDCKCINCEAKESPIREIWIKDITIEELSEIEIFDWLEGVGMISSLSQQNFIRKYGFLLAKLQNDPQWDCTDAAHPAWWRGEKSGAEGFAKIINDVLLGRNKCTGKMEGSLEHIRNSVMNLRLNANELLGECGRLTNKIQILKEQNKRQANTIGGYQKGDERIKLLKQIDGLFIKIGKLEIEKFDALEQRTADWDAIHKYEKDIEIFKGIIENLKGEILIMENKIREVMGG